MPNPFAGGTERNKLFAYAAAKGNTDKAATQFAEHHAGRNYFDVSGGTAVPRTNLPTGSSAVAAAR